MNNIYKETIKRNEKEFAEVLKIVRDRDSNRLPDLAIEEALSKYKNQTIDLEVLIEEQAIKKSQSIEQFIIKSEKTLDNTIEHINEIKQELEELYQEIKKNL